jgi:nucleotide-binding universal stress UspA family protein
VADAHPNILHYPPGKVVMRGFGDSGLKLQLRCWIADVTVRADTISDLLKATKDRFDKGGIEIPFPYRTIVYKKEMAKPFSPKEELKPFTRIVEGMQDKILVAVAGPQPVRERASFVASLAKALSAGVVALYINRPGARREQGEDALRIMGDVARNQRIWYKPVVRSGDIVSTIRDVAREEDVDLILVGAGRGSVASLWRRTPEIGSRLRQELSRPVFTVPRDLKLTPQLVAWLMDQIKGFQEQRQQGKAAAAEPKGTLERALADEKPLGPSDSGTARPAASPDAEPPARDEDSSKREDGPSRGP